MTSFLPDDQLLARCISIIESRLGWGSSSIWTNQDFEALSEKIMDATGVNLSVVTLKRLWGKLRYDSKPTVTTLNAIAQFAGFDHWRHFKHEQGSVEIGDIIKTSDGKKQVRSWFIRKQFRWVWGTILVCTVTSLVVVLLQGKNTGFARINVSAFSFSSRKIVSAGLPNSVVFDYNATAAAVSDTVLIQQSWDKRLSQQVARLGHQHTSLYYYPGYFRAKLVVNGHIVKEHPVNIKTEGWLAMIEQPDVPVYLDAKSYQKEGMLTIPESLLSEHHINTQPNTPWVSFHNVREFGDLHTDNFRLDAVLQNNFGKGSGICRNAEITVLSENGAIVLPLSAKGCVSGLKAYLIDKEVDGKTEDLSGFGCDLSRPVKITCTVRNREMNVFLNDSLAYRQTIAGTMTKLEGIRFRFLGTGTVYSVKLSDNKGNIIYSDSFR